MSSQVVSNHKLPELPERSGLGSRLVRHAVAMTFAVVALLAAALVAVLMAMPIEITIDGEGIQLRPAKQQEGADG